MSGIVANVALKYDRVERINAPEYEPADIAEQERNRISCFLLNDDGTVTRPCGHVMTKLKLLGSNTVYSNKDASRQCPLRCTGGKGFGPGVKTVPVRMYGKMKEKLNQLPKDTVLYNSFWRRDHARRQVILRIRPDPKKLKQRMCPVGAPVRHSEVYDGAHYLLCKGNEKGNS